MAKSNLQKLAPHHRIAVSLKLTGQSHKDIAESLNTSKAVVDRWMKDELVKAEIERQTELAVTTIHQKIAGGIEAAIDGLTRIVSAPLESVPGPDARVNAADKLLRLSKETHPDQHAPQQPNAGIVNVTNLMGNMSPEERTEFARRAAKKLLETPADVPGQGREVKAGSNGKA